MSELWSVPCVHTADSGICLPTTSVPLDSAYVSKWGGKFGFQYKSFLFFRVLSEIIFSKTLQLSGVFIKNLLGNYEIRWPIGTWEMYLSGRTALQPCLYVHSHLFFFFFNKSHLL